MQTFWQRITNLTTARVIMVRAYGCLNYRVKGLPTRSTMNGIFMTTASIPQNRVNLSDTSLNSCGRVPLMLVVLRL
ncbi:unnamed protein product [Oppiella nova]|uniref:Uncharacterized protein n=1 Tax=Oppiella nova TaxID=334625 RepID=A0A7R9M3T1_9ACAR|nr:unnamed protein product [Oppiella nova]CAG2170233.1 unnamed protein product [Oppiella nova]